MKLTYLLAILLVISGCRNTKKSEYSLPDKTDTPKEVVAENHPGKKILETECYICHNPKTSEDSMIAPPMIAIKKHYINEETTKIQFQNDLVSWINDPIHSKSKMPGALKKFGIMPLQPYPEEKVKLIAEYIYDYDIDEPDWFEEHYQKGHGKQQGKGKHKGTGKGKQLRKGMGQNEASSTPSEIGLKYALSTKAQLGKNLLKAIQEQGTVGAIEFCKLEAMKLTDSMSVMHNAIINRVSDKARNPKNSANAKELSHIRTFKASVKTDSEINPIVEEVDGVVNFYYPIMTNTMCLQCHGTPNEQIADETFQVLHKLYPEDKATGYDVGQVRGIWSITYDVSAQ
jgi:nitrate reductase cytochrome c-type subunit